MNVYTVIDMNNMVESEEYIPIVSLDAMEPYRFLLQNLGKSNFMSLVLPLRLGQYTQTFEKTIQVLQETQEGVSTIEQYVDIEHAINFLTMLVGQSKQYREKNYS